MICKLIREKTVREPPLEPKIELRSLSGLFFGVLLGAEIFNIRLKIALGPSEMRGSWIFVCYFL